MDNLLAVLLLWKALQHRDKPTLGFSSKSGRALGSKIVTLVSGGLKEALAAVLALLLVASGLAFFYLYCLPWLGVH